MANPNLRISLKSFSGRKFIPQLLSLNLGRCSNSNKSLPCMKQLAHTCRAARIRLSSSLSSRSSVERGRRGTQRWDSNKSEEACCRNLRQTRWTLIRTIRRLPRQTTSLLISQTPLLSTMARQACRRTKLARKLPLLPSFLRFESTFPSRAIRLLVDITNLSGK